MAERGMQVQAPVGRVAVQVEGDSHEGDLHHQERHEHELPKAKIQNSIQKIDVHCGYLRTRSGATVRVKENRGRRTIAEPPSDLK
jgi:hypothetical protein